MHGKRGQVSQEFLFALGFVFLFFMSMLLYYYGRMDSSRDISETMEKRRDCMILSSSITAAYLSPGSSAGITILHDAELRGSLQLARIEGYPCSIPVSAFSDANLSEGAVQIEGGRGFVGVSNG